MTIMKRIDLFCSEHQLISAKSTIVLGLSGGPDSIFLLHYLAAKAKQQEICLIAAHLDHQWRAESAKDVEFCQEQTKQLGVNLVCAKASDLSLSLKFDGSKEGLGRKMRRHFLEKVRVAENANCIALAHHQQDQYETFFIRLFRGSTVSGLRGMRPRYQRYIRPLLATSRTEIMNYLHKHKLPYLVDPSNESPLFLRNRIRHQLLPLCTTIDKRFEQNLARTLSHIADADDCLEVYTQQLVHEFLRSCGDYQALHIDSLLRVHPYLQKRVLVTWFCAQNLPFEPSDAWLDEIIRFLTNKNSKCHTVHPDWSILKKRGMVYCITAT